jgi:chlorite dismutase
MQFHSYIFFDATPALYTASKPSLAKAKKECIAVIKKAKDARVHAYATLALRTHSRFALHINAASADAIQLLIRGIMRTSLGAYIQISYTLLGCTRASPYNPKHAPKEADWDLAHRYLVVYPFTKTTEWHLMPYEERRNIMKAHVDVGRTFSDRIAQRLLYSYGIDDHEFIVSYQMDSLEEFQSLVMAMRETESRRQTKNDLPILTCIHMPLSEALEML